MTRPCTAFRACASGGRLGALSVREHCMGWEMLKEWGAEIVRVDPLAGGAPKDVQTAYFDERNAVARLRSRSDADLLWETDLLRYLARNGFAVPIPIPTPEGRAFVRGLTLMPFVEGDPTATAVDCHRLADVLRRLHAVTRNWPQRPSWRSSLDLLSEDKGTKIDLTAMPREGVARCRAAWARAAGRETSIVHGDPNAGKIRMTGGRITLIDWDAARVDVPDLDLVLPHGAGGLRGPGPGDRVAGIRGLEGCHLLGPRLRTGARGQAESRLRAPLTLLR